MSNYVTNGHTLTDTHKIEDRWSEATEKLFTDNGKYKKDTLDKLKDSC